MCTLRCPVPTDGIQQTNWTLQSKHKINVSKIELQMIELQMIELQMIELQMIELQMMQRLT